MNALDILHSFVWDNYIHDELEIDKIETFEFRVNDTDITVIRRASSSGYHFWYDIEGTILVDDRLNQLLDKAYAKALHRW